MAAAPINWTERLKLEIRGIDDDHFILVSLVAELEEALHAGRGRETLRQALANLVCYMKMHFRREERILKVHRYPLYEAHKAQHDSFARQILEFTGDYETEKRDITADVVTYLRQWIVSHVMSSDRKYAAYLQERGVR